MVMKSDGEFSHNKLYSKNFISIIMNNATRVLANLNIFRARRTQNE